MKYEKYKLAAVSTEVAVGIAMASIAVIVGIGLFSDNMSNLVSNSGLSNVLNGNSEKTQYDSFNVDYSRSRVEVQIVGEQGLQMLRRRANNKAIEIIEESYSNSNSDGNSIAYLSAALVALTGEPHVCVYMNKDSDEHCDKIGGYNYELGYSGSALVISKTNTAGTDAVSSISIPVSGAVESIIGSSVIQTDNNGNSTLNESQKYDYIKQLSINLLSYIRSDVVLINVATDGVLSKTSVSGKTTRNILKKLVNNSLNRLSSLVSDSHDKCTTKTLIFKIDLDTSNGKSGCSGFFSNLFGGEKNSFITKSEVRRFDKSISAIESNINSYNGHSSQELINLLLDSNEMASIIDILQQDHKNNPTACDTFRTSMQSIATQNSLNINIPECKPY